MPDAAKCSLCRMPAFDVLLHDDHGHCTLAATLKGVAFDVDRSKRAGDVFYHLHGAALHNGLGTWTAHKTVATARGGCSSARRAAELAAYCEPHEHQKHHSAASSSADNQY